MTRDVAYSVAAIRTTAPNRSDQGARLKKTHQTRTANPPATPPITPKATAPGTAMGTTNLASHCSATATTPGHSRIGLRGSSVCAMVMFTPYACYEQLVPPP